MEEETHRKASLLLVLIFLSFNAAEEKEIDMEQKEEKKMRRIRKLGNE